MNEPIHVSVAPYEVVETGGGSSDHSTLSNRSLPNQHPISAITGLGDALDGKVSKQYVDGEIARVEAEIPSTDDFATSEELQAHTGDSTIHVTASQKTEWSGKADASDIPTKTSDLVNDSGYLTEHQSLAAYRTALAQDTIDANQDAALTAHETASNPHGVTKDQVGLGNVDNVQQFSAQNKPTWDDVTGKPTIPTVPTNVSAFTNDAGYLTEHQDISGKENASNKVTSISAASTDTQYPSAKCVWDIVGNVESALAALL